MWILLLFGLTGSNFIYSEITLFGKYPFLDVVLGHGGTFCSSGRRSVPSSDILSGMAFTPNYGLILGSLLALLHLFLVIGLFMTRVSLDKLPSLLSFIWVEVRKKGKTASNASSA